MRTATDLAEFDIEIGGERVPVKLRRSTRRSLGITVNPDRSVVVAAPTNATPEEIGNAVKRRSAWILRVRREFEVFYPRKPVRRFVSGESHLYLGREYRLRVEQGLPEVTSDGDRLVVSVPYPSERPEVARTLRRWYRERAKETLTNQLTDCMRRFTVDGIKRPTLVVRSLNKRWGSMSPDRATMLLNVRLVEAAVDEIDYVVTHELCHAVHPNHGRAFYQLLSRKMPDWRVRKQSLEVRFS